MLRDWHEFDYVASIPWPHHHEYQESWQWGVDRVESWLETNVGRHWSRWAWADSGVSQRIGVAFRWDQDRTLFLLVWD